MTSSARFASLAFAALVVAGCSSSSSGGSGNVADTTPPAVTSSPSASTSPTVSESPAPTPSFSSTVQASRRCKFGDLKIALGQGQGAAGSTIVSIVFTNQSSRPCTMFGYPGVSFLDSSHAQIGAPADRRGGEEAVVTLGAGDAANAQLRIPEPGNFAAADCKAGTSAFLRVYPPGETQFSDLADSTQVCTTQTGRSVVLPVTPGTGG